MTKNKAKILRRVMLIIILGGSLISLFGLSIMSGAALPYQDPTEEMLLNAAREYRIGKIVAISGLVTLGIGIAGAIAAWITEKNLKSKNNRNTASMNSNKLSPKVKEFIAEHDITNGECLFKDWETFLDLLYSEGGRISIIGWWDHCTHEEHKNSVGMGGYKDPEDPDYVYSEIQSENDDLETKTLKEIKEYIEETQKAGIKYNAEHYSHELVPSFFLDV